MVLIHDDVCVKKSQNLGYKSRSSVELLITEITFYATLMKLDAVI